MCDSRRKTLLFGIPPLKAQNDYKNLGGMEPLAPLATPILSALSPRSAHSLLARSLIAF